MKKFYKRALLSSILLTTGAHATIFNGLYDNAVRDFEYTKKAKEEKTTVTNQEVIKQVQKKLRTRGYAIGEIDGVYGPHTRDILAKFQRDEGIPQTGRITAQTLSALNLEYAPLSKDSQTYSE